MNPAQQKVYVPLAFERAVGRFRQTLTDEENKIFKHLTTEQDVWDLAEKLQDEQGSRNSLQNMGRIEPFISGMRQYANVIEVFVQAKPELMSLIWGPLKLLLELASRFTESFEKMLDAIGRIGENLPRFRRFAEIFSYSDQMQEVISTVYEDIMEFYRRALKFFRRRAWKIVFSLTWTTFESRFGLILSNLKRHQSLVDTEARAEDIVQSHKAREEDRKRVEKLQKDEMMRQMKEVVTWLEPVNTDDKDNATALRSPGTGIWLADTKEVKEWVKGKGKLIWLTGKPGSGKTILSSAILEHLGEKKLLTKSSWPILYFFCSYKQAHSNTCMAILRTLIYQIVEQKRDLIAYVYEELMKPLSISMLTQLFYDLLEASVPAPQYVYIILDGLDELPDGERRIILPILKKLRSKPRSRPQLSSVYSTFDTTRNKPDFSSFCRIFVASRDLGDIRIGFDKATVTEISIEEKNTEDILQYIDFESNRVVEELGLDTQMGKHIFDSLSKRADGMFLWVHLIIESLILQTTRGEVLAALKNLPKGLDQAYERILQRIKNSYQAGKTKKILEWMTCASRTLKIGELEDAMAINLGDATLHEDNRLFKDHLKRLCGPIVEFSQDNIIFVHFSAKEYLLSSYSGPFIDCRTAHLNISLVCTTYQCFDCFEPALSTDQAARFVLNGDFRLFEYVQSNWLEHVKEFCELHPDNSQLKPLSDTLQELFKRRSTQLPSDSPQGVPFDIVEGSDSFECFEPGLRIALIQVLGYRERLTQKISDLGPGDELVSWCSENNPLTLDQGGQLLQKTLEDLLNMQPPVAENIDRLQSIYGSNLYMCRYQFCKTSSEGFATQAQRKIHEDKHAKPYKCQVQGCSYGTRDFTSKGKLQKHMEDYHTVATVKSSAVALEVLVGNGQEVLWTPDPFPIASKEDILGNLNVANRNSPTGYYFDILMVSNSDYFGTEVVNRLLGFGKPQPFIESAIKIGIAQNHIDIFTSDFRRFKEYQDFQVPESSRTEILLRRFSNQLKSWSELAKAFYIVSDDHSAMKQLVMNILCCREQYLDEFETPRGEYSMSISMIERTRELMTKCYAYIQNASKADKADAAHQVIPQQPDSIPTNNLESTAKNDIKVASQAHQVLIANGINPDLLTPQQILAFQSQHPIAQQKSIQLYTRVLREYSERAQTQPSQTQNPPPLHPTQQPIMTEQPEVSRQQMNATRSTQHVQEEDQVLQETLMTETLMKILEEERDSHENRQPLQLGSREQERIHHQLSTKTTKGMIHRTDKLLPMFVLLGGISQARIRELIRTRNLLSSQYQATGEPKEVFTLNAKELTDCKASLVEYFIFVKESMSGLRKTNSKKAREIQVRSQQLVLPHGLPAPIASDSKRQTRVEAEKLLAYYEANPEKTYRELAAWFRKQFGKEIDITKISHSLRMSRNSTDGKILPDSTAPSPVSHIADETKISGMNQKPTDEAMDYTSSILESGFNVGVAGKCSICSVDVATAQQFYEHFDECVLKAIQGEPFSEMNLDSVKMETTLPASSGKDNKSSEQQFKPKPVARGHKQVNPSTPALSEQDGTESPLLREDRSTSQSKDLSLRDPLLDSQSASLLRNLAFGGDGRHTTLPPFSSIHVLADIAERESSHLSFWGNNSVQSSGLSPPAQATHVYAPDGNPALPRTNHHRSRDNII